MSIFLGQGLKLIGHCLTLYSSWTILSSSALTFASLSSLKWLRSRKPPGTAGKEKRLHLLYFASKTRPTHLQVRLPDIFHNSTIFTPIDANFPNIKKDNPVFKPHWGNHKVSLCSLVSLICITGSLGPIDSLVLSDLLISLGSLDIIQFKQHNEEYLRP